MASNREHQRRFLDRQRAQGLRRLALQVPPEDPGRWAATGALIAEAEAAGILWPRGWLPVPPSRTWPRRSCRRPPSSAQKKAGQAARPLADDCPDWLRALLRFGFVSVEVSVCHIGRAV